MSFGSLEAAWPKKNTSTEFTYVWNGNKWLAGDPDEGTQSLVDLKDLLDGKVEIHPAIKVPFVGMIGHH
jgi:hypothetical protein